MARKNDSLWVKAKMQGYDEGKKEGYERGKKEGQKGGGTVVRIVGAIIATIVIFTAGNKKKW